MIFLRPAKDHRWPIHENEYGTNQSDQYIPVFYRTKSSVSRNVLKTSAFYLNGRWLILWPCYLIGKPKLFSKATPFSREPANVVTVICKLKMSLTFS